jgi:hypothetical protein
VSEDQKITISWEEADRVDTGTKPPVVTVGTAQVPPTPPAATKAMVWPWLLGGAGALFLVVFVVSLVGKGGLGGGGAGQTVEAWIGQERPKWSADISGSAKVKEFIENIHPLVTYKRAGIAAMRAVTIDGSNNAGRRGGNISEVEMLVTFYWEGPVTKDGFTEVRFNYDYQGRQLKARRFERSNAAINLETVDWIKVGAVIGTLLF